MKPNACYNDPLLRCAVLDDERTSSDLMRNMAENCFSELGAEAAVESFEHAEDMVKAGHFDLYLLDIVFDGETYTGMELARRIRRSDPSAHVIFFTANTEYAVEGYDVEAIGFLPKPVSRETLLSAIKRFIARRSEHGEVTISTPSGTIRATLDSIEYAEVFNHDIVLHMRDGETERFPMTLSYLMEILPARQFVRCHRSYVARLGAIRSVRRYSIRLESGSEIPVSKTRYNEVQAALLDRAIRR